jgi:hypothetical protein
LSPGCVNCTAVFDLVAWWTTEKRALERARKALRLRNIWPSDHDEPFAAIIRCTADPAKVDRRTRSEWSRVLRYAAQRRSNAIQERAVTRARSTA